MTSLENYNSLVNIVPKTCGFQV